ncbi:GNAT family N-acetyltransferase [Oxalobacter paraformigenes]|uniref:GNAT family N-acetyltransferase n=1 Tax=Oxalobacter paraformigenes TaxID=556268 RepID=UPI0002DBBB83
MYEIGYLFNRNFRAKGYATEAASACKRYCFDVPECRVVCSIIRDNNIPSQKVAVKNGMKKIGETIKDGYKLKMLHCIYRS